MLDRSRYICQPGSQNLTTCALVVWEAYIAEISTESLEVHVVNELRVTIIGRSDSVIQIEAA